MGITKKLDSTNSRGRDDVSTKVMHIKDFGDSSDDLMSPVQYASCCHHSSNTPRMKLDRGYKRQGTVFNLVTSGIILAKMEVFGVNIFSEEASGVLPLWSLYAVQSWHVNEQCCLSGIGEGSMLGPMCFVTTLMDVIVLHKMETEGN